MKKVLMILAGVTMLAAAGCSTLPERIDAVEEARSTVQNLERRPLAEEVAAAQLSKAREALARADTAIDNGEPLEEIRHHAYVARRHAEIGLEMIQEAEALAQVESAEGRRNELQLQARTAAAERAERLAETRAAKLDERAAELKEARASADSAEQEASRLAQELQELEAKQTERGLVLTLSDVLFATDSAELKPGSQRAIDRLAEFLQDHSERNLLIEGHTDARGAEAYNERLSNHRADSVAEALVQRGIPSSRLRSVGLGEAYPVASNETVAGRQQNRRVEIVVSEDDGSFPENAVRAPVVRR